MSAIPVDLSPALPSLIDQLLAEQQALSAVEIFSRRQDEGTMGPDLKRYEERISFDASELRPGQQLAFQVDLDACTGCKACVTACHSMNGLAEEETWREVGLAVGDGGAAQTLTTACHHCEDPACLSGCPVLAYEKDPVTGIVRHLDDQCIGCQYCILKCPYDVPKFSSELKIVRKCDMCTGRLSAGESPACVQACPTGAISITIVDLLEEKPASPLIAGLAESMPDASITRPTTRYLSNRKIAALKPSDWDRVTPASAHDPLAVMLVLLQLSVGALGIGSFASLAEFLAESALSLVFLLAAATALLGLAAATLHLGRPSYAFRAFLGWRTSWMSREIIVVGAYVPIVAMLAMAASVVQLGGLPGWESSLPLRLASGALPILQTLALVSGAMGIGCSMMIYIDTRRVAWGWRRTGPLFLGTLGTLGAFGVAAASVLGAILGGVGEGGVLGALPFLVLGLSLLAGKCWIERALITTSRESVSQSPALMRGAGLMHGVLRPRARLRWAFAVVSLCCGFAAIAMLTFGDTGVAFGLSVGVLLFAMLGEFVERHLYFTSEASPSMPGH
jgi:Fe-S-cluster-containing dehydrogenase component/DMSO reductase anchor subunit